MRGTTFRAGYIPQRGRPFFKYAPGHEATMLTEVRVVPKEEARVTRERTREREKGRKGEEGETVDTSYA